MTITQSEIRDLALASELLQRAAYPDEDSGPSVGERLALAIKTSGRRSKVNIQVRAVEYETGTASVLLAAGQPHLADFQRRLFLRDVIPAIPTSTYSTPFVRELNPTSTEAGASGVEEGTAKPDVGFSLQGFLNTPGTLAAEFTASEQLMADSPGFVAYTNRRLPYEIRVREEIAMISGNAEVANAGIVGFRHTSGVVTVSGTGLPGAIAAAAGTVAGNGVVPDVAVVNAADLWAAYLASPVFFDSDSLPIQIVATTAIPAGLTLAGSFATGAVINDRQQVSITVFPEHADYAARGLVLVLTESRIGFEVLQPWAFSLATY